MGEFWERIGREPKQGSMRDRSKFESYIGCRPKFPLRSRSDALSVKYDKVFRHGCYRSKEDDDEAPMTRFFELMAGESRRCV